MSKDRICVNANGLELVKTAGLFTTRKTFPKERILQFYSARSAFMLSTLDGVIELTTLGTAEQYSTLATSFAKELRLPIHMNPALPKDWETLYTEQGQVLVKSIKHKKPRPKLLHQVFL